MNYIRRFSATEKAIFGALVIIAAITALIMAGKVNAMFMTEIPGNDGHLTEGVVGLPHTVNPVLAVTDVDRDLSALIYSGLTKNENGDVVNDLAASSSISKDGLTYSFTLKNDLRFQDGSPLTTDDVAYTIQRIQDAALKSPRRADWKDVSIKVVSPTVIQFSLKEPYSPFMSITSVGIIPKHIWNALNDDQFVLSQYNVEPIGSGPYKESSIGKGNGGIPSSYTVSTWNGYYGTKPHIASITFNFYADQDKALSALDDGSIDSLPSVGSADAARLASDSAQAYTLVSAPLPRIFGVFFNQGQAPVLADKNVRTALNMVVDRQAMVQTALNGYGVPVTGPLPWDTSVDTSSGQPTLTLSTKIAAATTSIEKALATAQSVLERAGWKRNPNTGFYQLQKKGTTAVQTLSFDIYTADTPDLKETAELLKNSWAALGVDVGVKIFEPADLYQNVIRTRKYDALLFGESIGTDRDLYAFWHSSERNAPGLNVALYANSKADKLLEDIRTTTDEKARTAKFNQFAQVISADVPAVFLYMPDFIYAVPRSLHNIQLGTVTIPSDRFNSVVDWYDTTEKVWKIFAHK